MPTLATTMSRSSTLLVVTTLLASSLASEAAPDPPAPTLLLISAGSPVAIDGEDASQLAEALVTYLDSCLTFGAVVGGEQPPQDELDRLWSDQSNRLHAVLHATGTDESRHIHLRGTRFTALFGLESESGPSPVLTRDESLHVTGYIKCPGLDGLLLACQVHGIVPGMSPSADCDRWRAIEREHRETEPAEGASVNP